jgi:two-component system, cell cycle response regulator DivK
MNKMVLIADHDANFINQTARYLAVKGFTVHAARDGAEALKKFYELLPDVIILDVLLPKVSGYQVVREIRHNQHGKTAKIIVTTGVVKSASLLAKFREKGSNADLIMDKPFILPDLLEHLARMLNIPWEELDDAKPTDKQGHKFAAPPKREEIKPRPGSPPPKQSSGSGTSREPEWSGLLEDSPLYRVLAKLHKSRATGRLRVESEGNKLNIMFERGQVIAVLSNYIVSSTLGRYLVEEGIVAEKFYEQAWRIAKESNRPVGQVLIESKHLSRPDLNKALIFHMEDKLSSVITARIGRFAFYRGNIAPDIEPHQINLARVIFETLEKRSKDGVVAKKIDPLMNQFVHPEDDPPFTRDELRQFPEKAEVLDMTDGARTVKQILGSLANPRKAITDIYILRMMKMIRFSEERRPA